jgi:hypothetical protein
MLMLICNVFSTYKMTLEARNTVSLSVYTTTHNTNLSQQIPEFIHAPMLQGLKDLRGEFQENWLQLK